MLRFGTSGIPLSTPRPGTPAGIRRARELGLDCFEMAWGNGIRMKDATSSAIALTSQETGVVLTAHAPYYVNLCGAADVVRRSRVRLLEAGRLAHRCGARSLCFHAGFYPTRRPGQATARVARHLGAVSRRLRDEGIDVDLRPELTGRTSQLGTADEILIWCEQGVGVKPCLDFAHLYARSGGSVNRYEDFAGILERVRTQLGAAAIRDLHVHVSGIEYGPSGERRHLPLARSRFRYRELLRALKDADAAGWVIAETPAMERDALLLRRTYRRLS